MVDFDKINERMKMDPGTRAILEVAESILAEVRGLRQGGAQSRPAASGAPASQRAAGGTGGGNGDLTAGVEPDPNAVFPNYGNNRGASVRGASAAELSYYANGARRSLGDPAKARFWDKERVLLASIEAEIARQSGKVDTQAGDGFPDGPPPDEDPIPF